VSFKYEKGIKMGTQKVRKVYSKEFKESAVRMVTEQGRRASEVARDLGISEQMLHTWKRKIEEKAEVAFPGKGRLRPQEAEVRDLKKEIARLKEEIDILKKAAKFFMNEHG
jgi:transposase